MVSPDGRWVAVLRTWWPTLATVTALVVGGVLALTGRAGPADLVWGVSIAGVTVSLLVEIVQQLRRREPGVDVIALLAMVGAILLGEFLAGAIIAWMLTTGRSLENGADARARRELTALLAASPPGRCAGMATTWSRSASSRSWWATSCWSGPGSRSRSTAS